MEHVNQAVKSLNVMNDYLFNSNDSLLCSTTKSSIGDSVTLAIQQEKIERIEISNKHGDKASIGSFAAFE